jgi:hypothetical protein
VSNYINKKIRQSANGRVCQFKVPGVCNGNSETVVWVHSDQQRHGKGTGIKAHDVFGAYGCTACHDWYAGGAERDFKREVFQLAHERSLVILVQSGILK